MSPKEESSAKQPPIAENSAPEPLEAGAASLAHPTYGQAPNYGNKMDLDGNGGESKGEKGQIDRSSGYGYGGGYDGGYDGGYEDESGSYGGYGGSGGYHGNSVNIRVRPNTHIDLGSSFKIKGLQNLRLPSINLPPIRGLTDVNLRVPDLSLPPIRGLTDVSIRVPNFRLPTANIGIPTDLDICPDIILSLIIAAGAAAVYLFYTTITAGRRRRRRRRRRELSSLPSSSSFSGSSGLAFFGGLYTAAWIGNRTLWLCNWMPIIIKIKLSSTLLRSF
jgi:hypothetical protein